MDFEHQKATTETYREQWERVFMEKKSRQLNDGPCAAVIVDCDCDRCLAIDTDREMRHRPHGAGEFEWHLPQRPQPAFKNGCPILEDK